MVQLNRLQANKLGLMKATTRYEKSERSARTRTLIQVGGLINLTGLLDYCGIKLGVDLQLDLAERHKAAMLLGLLTEMVEQLPKSLEQQNKWLELGIRILKQQEAKKYYVKQ